MTKEERRIIVITIIISLIIMIISGFYTSVTGKIYTTIGEFITYKWLINLSVLFLLIIVLLFYFYPKSPSTLKEVFDDNSHEMKNKKEKKEEKYPSQKDIDNEHKEILQNLSKDEKLLLSEYIDNDTKTREYSLHNGVAMGLLSMGVLYHPSLVGHGSGVYFSFNLNTWSWKMLKDNPKYLK